jgi:hypothetical protein
MFTYFLIGLLLATVGSAFLSGITEVICSFTELLKAKINVKILQHNVLITQLNEQLGETQTRAIGFCTTFEEDDEDD